MDTELISGIQFKNLPSSYVRPESDRPRLFEVSEYESISMVDLAYKDRSVITKQIGNACREYGFFQVINHGVPKEIVEIFEAVAHEFFKLPVEEKMKLYSKTVPLSTSFNLKKETVHNWNDYLRLHCYPLERYAHEWPSVPSSFKDDLSNCYREIEQLKFRLQEAIAENLGLDKDGLKRILGEQGQHMAMNYYPKCPEPELMHALPGQTDPNALTILLQDPQVAGFRVFKNGNWLSVKPHPDAFLIEIGDRIQDLSNRKSKPICHRAVADKPRLSTESFVCLCDCAESALRSPDAEYYNRCSSTMDDGLKAIPVNSYNLIWSEAEKRKFEIFFDKLDSDGDKKVSFEELRDKNIISNDLLFVFTKLDTNGNGVLDFYEVLCLYYYKYVMDEIVKSYYPSARFCKGLACARPQKLPDFSCFLCLHKRFRRSYHLCSSCYTKDMHIHMHAKHPAWYMLNRQELEVINKMKDLLYDKEQRGADNNMNAAASIVSSIASVVSATACTIM